MSIAFGEQFVFSSTTDVLYEEYFLPIYLANKEFPSLICGNTEWEKSFLNLLNLLCKSGVKQSAGCELEWRILLLEIFHLAYLSDIFVKREQPQDNKLTIIRSSLLFIKRNFTEHIEIHDLAKNAGFSTEYFCRVFKSIVKKTPMEYIIACRIKQAEYLLTHTSDSISDIALASGFCDINYFSRCFKKNNTITPSQYRRNFS